MDHFGIGAGVKGSVLTYLQSARRTGRTTSLVESLKDGDRVIFTNNLEANRVRELCLERGISIKTAVVDPKSPQDVFNLERSRSPEDKRTLFDHSWVELFYLHAIEQVERNIDSFQTNLSSYGEPHLETKRRAEEFAKWDWK